MLTEQQVEGIIALYRLQRVRAYDATVRVTDQIKAGLDCKSIKRASLLAGIPEHHFDRIDKEIR